MTREEAISIMSVIVHMLETQYDTDRIEDAVEMAIKALEQESCDDAISRQVAIVALDDRMSSLDNVDMQIAMGFAKGIIHELPPVNPQEPYKNGSIDNYGTYT